MTRILVVDDEPALLDAVTYQLQREGFEVAGAGDGATALSFAREEPYDLIILDLTLPEVTGLEVCRTLRTESAVPIIMLTARSSEIDRVLGLELGADDYIVKPFSMAELTSRVRAILRRRQFDRGSDLLVIRQVGSLHIDLAWHQVSIDSKPINLTPSEFQMLVLLAGEPGRAFTRREIMMCLWNSEYVGDERACDLHASNIRAKIEEDPRHPRRLVTVRGVGYKLMAV